MKTKITYLFFFLSLFVFTRHSHCQIGELVVSFPSPANNPTGLAWDGTYLWNADAGTNKIYKIDVSNGGVIMSIPGPSGATINGLTWDGSFLWCSDNQNHRLCKINPTDGSVVHIINLQSNTTRGLTYDGQYLYYQDSQQRHIYKIDPLTDTLVDTLISPGGFNRGLAWDGNYLWSSDRDKNEIYMGDPHRGSVITILPAPGTYSYGLTFDGEFLWNADYDTKKIYKISIRGIEKFQISNPLQVTIRYSVNIKNVGSTAMDLKTYLAYPFATDYQRLDDMVTFTQPPNSFFMDKYDQRIAFYQEHVQPSEEKLYQWSVHATLYNIRYFLHPDSIGTLEEIPQAIIDMYTTGGEKYYITHPSIIAAVQQAIRDETNLYWKVRNIHDYIISKIEYVNDHRWDDAPTVLNQGHGSCSEYSFLFIAMCRAAGIPARFEAGGHLRNDIPYEDRVFHRWQQVYFPNYGWVPIDCTWDDKSYPSNQARYFGALSNSCFSTTIGGGGEYGLWWTYNSANSSSGGLREREKIMEWLPYSTTVEMFVESMPDNKNLCFNFPNPLNNQTTINFFLTQSSSTKLKIFNSIGQLIYTEGMNVVLPGWQKFVWNAKDRFQNTVVSGTYYYQIESESVLHSGQMTLIK